MKKGANEKDKTIVEILLDFTLPPPVYGFHLTTKGDAVSRTLKGVRSIEPHPHGVLITGHEGGSWVINHSSIKYWVEE